MKPFAHDSPLPPPADTDVERITQAGATAPTANGVLCDHMSRVSELLATILNLYYQCKVRAGLFLRKGQTLLQGSDGLDRALVRGIEGYVRRWSFGDIGSSCVSLLRCVVGTTRV